MMRTILNWYTGAVLWEGEAETVKDAIHAAYAVDANLGDANLGDANLGDADLGGANLGGADLRGANLGDANLGDANLPPAILPTGETWTEYLTDVVPALLTAGGKALQTFAEHWECHTWKNCPMAHAFNAPDLKDVPALYRPRAEQFIQFFDARLIPWPLPAKDAA